MNTNLDRRALLAYLAGLGLTSTVFPRFLCAQLMEPKGSRISEELLRNAAHVAGLSFTEPELEAMLAGVNQNLSRYTELREVGFDNGVAPPLYFNPVLPGMTINRTTRPLRLSKLPRITRPHKLEEIAFFPVLHLAELIRTKQVTSAELTGMYLDRLKRYGPTLNCVVTLTEEHARRQAREADNEIAAGRYRGPLHGIPWGVKDLFATKGYPTSWGAAPYRNRILNEDATVVSRLMLPARSL